jgi:hypothetical protein
MEKIKENIHLILLANLFLTLIILLSSGSGEAVNLVIINGEDKSSNETVLKKAICQQAVNSWKDRNLSKYYMHPEIIDYISDSEDDDFDIKDVEKFYIKMEGREICRIVAKKKEGFSAFEAVISKGGPLIHRMTSIKAEKPTYKEVKEYL